MQLKAREAGGGGLRNRTGSCVFVAYGPRGLAQEGPQAPSAASTLSRLSSFLLKVYKPGLALTPDKAKGAWVIVH